MGLHHQAGIKEVHGLIFVGLSQGQGQAHTVHTLRICAQHFFKLILRKEKESFNQTHYDGPNQTFARNSYATWSIH